MKLFELLLDQIQELSAWKAAVITVALFALGVLICHFLDPMGLAN